MLVVIQRGYDPSEVDELFGIHCACFDCVKHTKRVFKRALEEAWVWVARDGDRPVGYLIADVEANEPKIRYVGIAERRRGEGIGTRLLRVAEHHFAEAGCDKIRLAVAFDNPAQCLYFRLGYRVTGVFKTRCLFLRMAKCLKAA